MADRRPLDLVPAFEALSTLMDAASALAGELRDDPLMSRWMAVFWRMPAADRHTVLEVVEREVEMRTASESGVDGLMGFRVTMPNPNARIYSRTLTQGPSYASAEEIAEALRRVAIMTHALLHKSHEPHPAWQEVAVETADALPPEELEAMEWYARVVLTIVDRVRARRAQPGAA